MDINDFRAWHTIVLLIAFLAIVWWAYSKKRKKSFDEAANLPFADEDREKATLKKEKES
jgi:cytochrome c oxidase cbb3-type subunit 4